MTQGWLGLAAAVVVLLGGCKLVDQTSFGAAPRAPAPDELASALASHGEAPLLVIRPEEGVPYEPALRSAIGAEEARGGAARYRLTSVVPAGGDLAAQQKALDANSAASREVLDAMEEAGVTPDRVVLGARTDPGVSRPELWLYADEETRLRAQNWFPARSGLANARCDYNAAAGGGGELPCGFG